MKILFWLYKSRLNASGRPDAPKEALQVEQLIQLLEKELGFVRYERS